MKNYVELLRKEFKNILSDLMEQADDIIDDLVVNHGVEVKIDIDIGCENLPNYTISTKRTSSKLTKSLNEKLKS